MNRTHPLAARHHRVDAFVDAWVRHLSQLDQPANTFFSSVDASAKWACRASWSSSSGRGPGATTAIAGQISWPPVMIGCTSGPKGGGWLKIWICSLRSSPGQT
jgi:hypothetical protein